MTIIATQSLQPSNYIILICIVCPLIGILSELRMKVELEFQLWSDMIVSFSLYNKEIFHHLNHTSPQFFMICLGVFRLETPHRETFCIKSKQIR